MANKEKYITIATGVRKRTGGSYEFSVSAGFDGSGKHIRKYTTYVPPAGVSEAKADRLALEAFTDFARKARGNKTFGENMRFSELCELYFENYAPNKLKKVTIEHYKSNVKNHLAPVFANKKLKDISTADITEFLTKQKYKPLTINKIKIVLHSILKYAVSQKMLAENPCSGAIWKENTEREYGKIENVLMLNQAKKLLGLLEEDNTFNIIIKLLLLTGMRVGECLALRWSSVDMMNKTIFIDKTLSYAEKTWFLSTPKTARSTRTIAIDDMTVDLLKRYKAFQDAQKEIVGDAWLHPEMLFTSCTGGFYDRNYLGKQFRRFIEKHREELGLDHNFTIHGLRHTNASLLLYAGETLEAISSHLGHSSADITSRVYAHMYAEVKIRIAKTISSALF
jgi:integrase